MNKKIRELAEQARAEVRAEWNKGNEIPYSEAHPAFQWDNDQKFAELIIKECLSIVDDAERGGNNETWDNAVKFIRRDLKEHFGVE